MSIVEFHFKPNIKVCACTFLSCLHAGDKVVALVPAIVLIRVIKWHPHSFILVPFIPDISSFDGVLDALFFGPQTTWTTPAYSKQDNKYISGSKTFTLKISDEELKRKERKERAYPSSSAADGLCSPPLACYLQTVWREGHPRLMWIYREQERCSPIL